MAALNLTSPHGYSEDAFTVAEALLNLSTESRTKAAHLLQDSLRRSWYSNQKFDLAQALALALTEKPE